MPELPEVETVRRTLEPWLVGRVVRRVALARPDIVAGDATPGALLRGCEIVALRRRGKQLAILASPASRGLRVLVVRLGMTGQLRAVGAGERDLRGAHVHARWTLSDRDGSRAGTLVFRDPRRFGGLFPFPSIDAVERAWAALGPDAAEFLDADDPRLGRLWSTTRAIKAALLDQRCLAGIGNIYADEALFGAGIHPSQPARRLTVEQRARLLDAIRGTLNAAIRDGGSTVRDYANANGERGGFQERHAAYGRGGLPCVSCGGVLLKITIAQRSTTFCPRCQPRGVLHKGGSPQPEPIPRKSLASRQSALLR
jgi:formamidopyrimidine-DNA glycosylase